MNSGDTNFGIKPSLVLMFAAMVAGALNGFNPAYETELFLWGACFCFSMGK